MAVGGALVGRREELRVTVGAVRSGGGVVIVGPPGVGKTRLARETLATVATDSATATDWVQATQATAPIPFGAFSAFVPDWDPVRSPDRLEVLQRLGRVFSDRGNPSEGHPLTLGVDDGHLLDEASAALVHQLTSTGTVKVVCTLRTGEVAPEPLVALWKDGAAERFHLQALARDEANELVVDILGGPVDIDTERRVWDATEGNPLYIRELVLHGRATGALRESRSMWRWDGELAAGPRLVEIVGARLRHLEADERRAMELLVLAPRVPLAALESIVASVVLEQLERAGLAATDDLDGRLVVRSAHPLYAEGLRAGLTPLALRARQAELARAVLESGAHRSEDDLWLSMWSVDAGVDVPATVLVHGARQANVMGDPATGERIARAAADAGGGFDAGMALADALARQLHYRQAEQVLVSLIADAPDDKARANITVRRIELLHYRLHAPEEEVAAVEAALATIADPEWRNYVLGAHATVLAISGKVREAVAIAEPILDDPATSPLVRLQTIAAAGNCWLLLGQVQRTLKASEDALLLALEHADEIPEGIRLAGSVRLFSLMASGDIAGAEQILELIDDFQTAKADTLAEGYRGLARGRLALMCGKPLTAARWLQDAALVLDHADNQSRLWWVLSTLAEARALVGDVAGADAALAEASTVAVSGTEFYARDGLRAEAWVAAAKGELSRAREILVSLSDRLEAAGEYASVVMILHDACRLGGTEEVGPRLVAAARHIDGGLFQRLGDYTDAVLRGDGAAIERAAAGLAAERFDLYAAEAAFAAARAYERAGLKARATAMANRGRQWAAQCEGARTPGLAEVPGSPADVLTRREREIAGLAASGLSSPDIAERLTLSVRTVQNHLQRIYAKLGVSNRHELTEVLGAED